MLNKRLKEKSNFNLSFTKTNAQYAVFTALKVPSGTMLAGVYYSMNSNNADYNFLDYPGNKYKNMKKQFLFGVIFVFVTFSLFSCADGTQNTSNGSGVSRNSLPGAEINAANNAMNSNIVNGSSAVNAGDNRMASTQDDFWIKAAQGGIAEVELSQLALKKAQNPEVKNFAQKMVADHTKANNELKALAAKKNVTLPTETDAAHRAKLNQLEGLSGADFDRAYVETMVSDHEATVQLFEKQASEEADPELKAFALKTLPNLKMHLEAIKNIQGKMK